MGGHRLRSDLTHRFFGGSHDLRTETRIAVLSPGFFGCGGQRKPRARLFYGDGWSGDQRRGLAGWRLLGASRKSAR